MTTTSGEVMTRRLRGTPPKPAVRLEVRAVDGRVVLTWEAEGDARYFWVLRRKPPEAGFRGVGATTFNELDDVPPGPGVYEYRVIAGNDDGIAPAAGTVAVAFFPHDDGGGTELWEGPSAFAPFGASADKPGPDPAAGPRASERRRV